jgi:hypothetical protein
MVLRDENGSIIYSACRWMPRCDDPFETELQACIEGVQLALENCQLPVIVETDCIALV